MSKWSRPYREQPGRQTQTCLSTIYQEYHKKYVINKQIPTLEKKKTTPTLLLCSCLTLVFVCFSTVCLQRVAQCEKVTLVQIVSTVAQVFLTVTVRCCFLLPQPFKGGPLCEFLSIIAPHISALFTSPHPMAVSALGVY